MHGPVIRTLETACQDCWKCVRECPVKAISVLDQAAMIDDVRCIKCGHCVAVCPAKAKEVRDDTGILMAFAASGRPWVASLAPSWRSAFPDLDEGQIVAALKHLGAIAVGQTAAGAEAVSLSAMELVKAQPERLHLASACPVAVAWALTQGLEEHVTPLASPLLEHARQLRLRFPHAQVVFFGPCIAKKMEADAYPGLLAGALTFADMRRLWKTQGLDPASLKPKTEDTFLERVLSGALYPVEGGMLAGLKADVLACDATLLSVSGLSSFAKALDSLTNGAFVELLACPGGCINGPCTGTEHGGTLKRRQAIIQSAQSGTCADGPAAPLGGGTIARTQVPIETQPDADLLVRTLESMGKTQENDELNCGGCGYDSCRALAGAIIAGRAEVQQCVSWMRRQAEQKAHALLAAMPAGAALIGSDLSVQEYNKPFAELFADINLKAPCALASVGTLGRMITHVLESGQDIVRRDISEHGKVLSATIFPIEPGRLAGIIILDITRPSLARNEVARRAKLVIEKQLATVQQIACLLGENAAENEIILESIADAFGSEDPKEGKR